MNYYPHHIGDYSRDTAHLSMLEDAAYRRMLDLYYASERALPMNRQGLYRLVRAKSKAEQNAVDVILGEFFQETDHGWRNARADLEISRAQEKSQSARESAGKRWQAEGNANALRTHSEGIATPDAKALLPITNSQEPIAKNQKRAEAPQRSRGSRLPAEWVPSEILKAWAVKERPDLNLEVTEERFRDYWKAVPGSKGLKLDWDATFRNWVRIERAGSKTKEIDYDALTRKLEEQERATG